jgi:hypothetical protein
MLSFEPPLAGAEQRLAASTDPPAELDELLAESDDEAALAAGELAAVVVLPPPSEVSLVLLDEQEASKSAPAARPAMTNADLALAPPFFNAGIGIASPSQ